METRPYQVATWLPEGQRGAYRVERFVVTGNEWQGFSPRTVPAGTYTRLMQGGTVVMSDTPAEWRDHSYFVDRAEGRVLVAGLGIGMVAAALIRKPEVTHLTIVEISPEVLALTGPALKALPEGGKVALVEADIRTWQPPQGERWDHAWYDIWDNISCENLPEMKLLHRRFGRRTGTQASWSRELCEYHARRDKAEAHRWRW